MMPNKAQGVPRSLIYLGFTRLVSGGPIGAGSLETPGDEASTPAN